MGKKMAKWYRYITLCRCFSMGFSRDSYNRDGKEKKQAVVFWG
jgi:hypothetical protein